MYYSSIYMLWGNLSTMGNLSINIGKPVTNGCKILGKRIPSGVIKHGWMENPRSEWSFFLKNTDFYGPFSSAMFDYRRVSIMDLS